MTTFDASRAILGKPDMFRRFRVPDSGPPLGEAGLKPSTSLLVFERAGRRHALLRDQMIYHHVAQGEVAGEPYLVSY